jgi:hypothetical protein
MEKPDVPDGLALGAKRRTGVDDDSVRDQAPRDNR